VNDHQRYAYGPKGEEISRLRALQWKHKHTKKRLTTIAAISNNNIIAIKTIEGSGAKRYKTMKSFCNAFGIGK